MLKIINNLKPFFEDCYRRINVREYARIRKISPPTASSLLNSYHKKGLLEKEKYRRYIFYYANKTSKTFINLSRIYWGYKLKMLIDYLYKSSLDPTIILFGSLSKAEVKKDSDIDMAVIGTNKKVDLSKFEKLFKRSIQLFLFKSSKDVRNKELLNNIVNGCILRGRLRL